MLFMFKALVAKQPNLNKQKLKIRALCKMDMYFFHVTSTIMYDVSYAHSTKLIDCKFVCPFCGNITS